MFMVLKPRKTRGWGMLLGSYCVRGLLYKGVGYVWVPGT